MGFKDRINAISSEEYLKNQHANRIESAVDFFLERIKADIESKVKFGYYSVHNGRKCISNKYHTRIVTITPGTTIPTPFYYDAEWNVKGESEAQVIIDKTIARLKQEGISCQIEKRKFKHKVGFLNSYYTYSWYFCYSFEW